MRVFIRGLDVSAHPANLRREVKTLYHVSSVFCALSSIPMLRPETNILQNEPYHSDVLIHVTLDCLKMTHNVLQGFDDE